jgi:hypothetical protein
MLTFEAQSLGGAVESASVPLGATSLATALLVGGLALIVYWWRIRAMRKVGLIAATEVDATPSPREVAADLQELTERLAAELDARADRLERLIAEADSKLAALERATSRVPEVHIKPFPVREQSDRPFAEIYELADQGLSAVEIARRTNRPTGQVELILNLRRGSVAM